MDAFCQRLMAQPPLLPTAEAELARRARAGDGDARDDLVTAAMRSVVQHALMLGARGERLRDAVQAGAVAVLGAVDRFDPDRGRLATYTWAAVGGAIVSELRARPDTHPLESTVEPPTTPPESAEHLLDGLSPRCREVVQLRFGTDGISAPLGRRETAERLGTSESRVRAIEDEAMRHLRHGLARIGDRAPDGSAPFPHSSIGRAFDC